MPTPAQIRAARGLLDWSQRELAKRAGLSPNALIAIEKGRSEPKASTSETIRRVLENAGVEFTDRDGVRKLVPDASEALIDDACHYWNTVTVSEGSSPLTVVETDGTRVTAQPGDVLEVWLSMNGRIQRARVISRDGGRGPGP